MQLAASPIHQLSLMSSTATAVKVVTVMMRKTRPNPANRRMDDRSEVARDSNWPDCQPSWKAGSRLCRCAYRSSRSVFSMPATALPWTQRRIRLRAASAMPRPAAASPSGSSRRLSWWVIAPSMIDLVSSGMAMAAASAPSAAISIDSSCRR
jgi:hypothetical protein